MVDRSRWSKNAAERFWSKVRKSDGCWEWTGSIGGHGYGTFYAGPNTYVPAHRFAFVCLHGDIESSVEIDHTCRNRSCVKPDHLRRASRKQNVENHGGARRNSKSGIRGVYWQKSRGLWQAQVTHNGNTVSKRFASIADAEAWVIEMRNQRHTYNDRDRKSA